MACLLVYKVRGSEARCSVLNNTSLSFGCTTHGSGGTIYIIRSGHLVPRMYLKLRCFQAESHNNDNKIIIGGLDSRAALASTD
jgi:hypothetical protein